VAGEFKVGCTWHPLLFLLIPLTVVTSDETLSTRCYWERNWNRDL